jgi:hypothetical protein
MVSEGHQSCCCCATLLQTLHSDRGAACHSATLRGLVLGCSETYVPPAAAATASWLLRRPVSDAPGLQQHKECVSELAVHAGSHARVPWLSCLRQRHVLHTPSLGFPLLTVVDQLYLGRQWPR